MLALLTLINLFNYLDRYVVAALLPAIKHDTGWSDTRLGFLATAFMLMYFIISPLFGWLGDRLARNRLMAAGVALWSLAAAGSGFARSYLGLVLARIGVGVGEASYTTISPAVLSDLYPKSRRGRIFAVFFMAIPVGSALGYLFGGLLESHFGWRHAFFLTGAPGILLAIALLFLKDPPRGHHDEEKPLKHSFLESCKALAGNPSYVFTVLGQCAHTFFAGAATVWIPSYMGRYLGVPVAKGNIVFGGITVVAGFTGTFVGGSWADAWAKRSSDAYLKIASLAMLLVLPLYLLAMNLNSFTFFCVTIFGLEFLLFLSTGPVNAQVVNCVQPGMRAMANAAAIFFLHLLGDAISPTLVGAISDRAGLKIGLLFLSIAILLSSLTWFAKVVFFFETLPWPKESFALPKAQCHRGYRGAGAQENTLAAFQAAKGRGAQMVELDVRLAKDGVPVVIHDDDIRRVSGKEGKVRDLTAVELKKLAQAPSLEEVLRDSQVPAYVNIELKNESAASDGMEKAVALVIQGCQAEGRVMFSSFNPLVLRRLAKLLPNVPRGLLVTEEKSEKNKFYLRKMLLAFLSRPHILHLHEGMYTESLARHLKAHNVPVAVWTVASADSAKKLLARGAESIISDEPRILS